MHDTHAQGSGIEHVICPIPEAAVLLLVDACHVFHHVTARSMKVRGAVEGSRDDRQHGRQSEAL